MRRERLHRDALAAQLRHLRVQQALREAAPAADVAPAQRAERHEPVAVGALHPLRVRLLPDLLLGQRGSSVVIALVLYLSVLRKLADRRKTFRVV